MYMFVSLHFRTLSHLQSISYQQKDTITNKQEGVFNNENIAIREGLACDVFKFLIM